MKRTGINTADPRRAKTLTRSCAQAYKEEAGPYRWTAAKAAAPAMLVKGRISRGLDWPAKEKCDFRLSPQDA